MKELLPHYNVSETLLSTIIEVYSKSVSSLRENVKLSIPKFMLTYKDMDWRFEINVS